MVRLKDILTMAHWSDRVAARGGLLIVLWALRGVTQVVLEILEGAYACGNLVVERADCVQCTALSGLLEVSPVRGVQGVVVNGRAGQLVVGTEAFCRR